MEEEETQNGEEEEESENEQEETSVKEAKDNVIKKENQVSNDIAGFTKIKLIKHTKSGDIFKAIENSSDHVVALKIATGDNSKLRLAKEKYVLQKVEGNPYYPQFKTAGKTSDCEFIGMEFLGPSLQTVRQALPLQRFSQQSAIKLAEFLLNGIEVLHKKGIIHRNITPDNILIRNDMKYPLVFTGFSHSKKAPKSKSKSKAKPKSSKYESPFIFKGKEATYRDDLISIMYIIAELIEGKLPWNGVSDNEMMFMMKKGVSGQVLFHGMPDELAELFERAFNTPWRDLPDYTALRRLAQRAGARAQYDESEFEWLSLSEDEVRRISEVDIVPAAIRDAEKRKKAERDRLAGYNGEIELKPLGIEDIIGRRAASPFKRKGPVGPLPRRPVQIQTPDRFYRPEREEVEKEVVIEEKATCGIFKGKK